MWVSTGVSYLGTGNKKFLRTKHSHIFSCAFEVPGDLQGM